MCEVIAAHGWRSLHGRVNQKRTREVQRCKGIEGGAEAGVIGDVGGDEPADEIARHVPGDIGRKGVRRVRGLQAFAEIGQCQPEGGRHHKPLPDAEQREDSEIARMRKE